MSKNLLISFGIFQPEIEKLLAGGEIQANVIFLNKYGTASNTSAESPDCP